VHTKNSNCANPWRSSPLLRYWNALKLNDSSAIETRMSFEMLGRVIVLIQVERELVFHEIENLNYWLDYLKIFTVKGFDRSRPRYSTYKTHQIGERS
jgi:hypothetical protein